jgi:hypothetical protein
MTEGYFEKTMREWGKTLDIVFNNILNALCAIPEEDVRKTLAEKGYKVKNINSFLKYIKKLRETTHG